MAKNQRLDLCGVPCPANAARALLRLESLEPGEELELLVDDGEPAENVSAALSEAGHGLLSRAKNGGRWRLVCKKGA